MDMAHFNRISSSGGIQRESNKAINKVAGKCTRALKVHRGAIPRRNIRNTGIATCANKSTNK